jgi:hypothetical protein
MKHRQIAEIDWRHHVVTQMTIEGRKEKIDELMDSTMLPGTWHAPGTDSKCMRE